MKRNSIIIVFVLSCLLTPIMGLFKTIFILLASASTYLLLRKYLADPICSSEYQKSLPFPKLFMNAIFQDKTYVGFLLYICPYVFVTLILYVVGFGPKLNSLFIDIFPIFQANRNLNFILSILLPTQGAISYSQYPVSFGLDYTFIISILLVILPLAIISNTLANWYYSKNSLDSKTIFVSKCISILLLVLLISLFQLDLSMYDTSSPRIYDIQTHYLVKLHISALFYYTLPFLIFIAFITTPWNKTKFSNIINYFKFKYKEILIVLCVATLLLIISTRPSYLPYFINFTFMFLFSAQGGIIEFRNWPATNPSPSYIGIPFTETSLPLLLFSFSLLISFIILRDIPKQYKNSNSTSAIKFALFYSLIYTIVSSTLAFFSQVSFATFNTDYLITINTSSILILLTSLFLLIYVRLLIHSHFLTKSIPKGTSQR